MFYSKPKLYDNVRADVGKPDFLIDQTASQDYNINMNGFPSSDITLLLKVQDVKSQEEILARLKDLRDGAFPYSKDMTDEQLIKLAIPRYYQTPSEISRFADLLAAFDEQALKEAEEAEKFKKVDDGTEVEPVNPE